MGHGLGPAESGASATLAQSDRFSLSAALRIDKGAMGSDAPILVGLPSVRSTLRARGSAQAMPSPTAGPWAPGPPQRFLGRGGGALVHQHWLHLARDGADQGQLRAGASFGDRTYVGGILKATAAAAPFAFGATRRWAAPASMPGGGDDGANRHR